MQKRIVFRVIIISLGLAACQANSLLTEPTPIIVPTRLVLPTPTVPTAQPARQPTAAHSLAVVTVYPSPVPPTLAPSPVPTRVGKYTGRAKGIELNEFTGAVDPNKLQADFGVVYGGEGWTSPVPNYKANVTALYQANIPCLLLWDIIIPPDFDASRLDKSFPPEQDEPNVAAIIKAIQNKAIAGIIIRFLDKDMPDGRVFTQTWMANYITWMTRAVHHQTDKPLFVMTSQAFISGFDEATELNSVISNIEGICSWKSATPGQTPQLASWNDFPFPADDYVPEYISGSSLYFINFARTSWRFEGIDASSTPLWMYKSSAPQLKTDLDYKDHDRTAPSKPTPTVSG